MVFNWEFVKQQGLTLTSVKDANTFQLLRQGLSKLLAPKKSCVCFVFSQCFRKIFVFQNSFRAREEEEEVIMQVQIHDDLLILKVV